MNLFLFTVLQAYDHPHCVTRMTPQRAQRLKDTCDTCSASKVRCDKQKPNCSRCERLSYHCFYSPASRKGRPHPSDNGDTQRISALSDERPSKQQKNAAESDGKGAQTVHGQQQQHHQGSHNTDNQLDPTLHYQADTSACNDSMDLPSYDNAAPCSSIPTPIDSMDTLHSHAKASNVGSSANAGSTIDARSTMSSYSDHSNATECSDCATLAMGMLQHMTTICMRPLPRTSATSFGYSPLLDCDGLSLEARIHAASTAIKRLSAILICPCSCNTDVGLLSSALCAAILDSYEIILRSSTNSMYQGSAHAHDVMNAGSGSVDGYGSTMSLINDVTSNRGTMQPCTESQGSGVSEQVIVRRVLEELPKAANLVMQLTRRYSATSGATELTAGKEGGVSELLPTLATGQKIRLRDMIEKTTNFITQT